MKKIQDVDIKGKKVIFRVGIDVSIENGQAKEKFKIQAVKEAADYLMSKKAKVAIMTYLGRPDGKRDMNFSLSLIKKDIEEILGYDIVFVPDCLGQEVARTMENLQEGEMALLENVRFYPGEGNVKTGEGYDKEYAKALAENFDIFVNDAFSQSHRNQASITGIPQYIPGYAGILLQKEVAEMEKVKNDFACPAVAVIGGAKIETKLPVISFFESKYDIVLVGGKIANEALEKNMDFSGKVILPEDFSGSRFDIGPRTIAKFQEIISLAKTIVWNGPLGKFEEEEYAHGTFSILDAILASAEQGAYVMIGGGETLEALEKRGATEKISFVSTGGGAMLEYLGGAKMPGIEVLKLKN